MQGSEKDRAEANVERLIIDMGDGTYGVVRGSKLAHTGLGSETAALRVAAKEYIEERADQLVKSALDHAVSLAFDSWMRISELLLPAGVGRDKLAELIRMALDRYFAPGGIEAQLESLHEAKLQQREAPQGVAEDF